MSNEFEKKFKTLIAEYSETKASEIKSGMRFREDLGFSSLDFMAFLGELEDLLGIDIDEDRVLQITTVGEAMEYSLEAAK